ncbi:hypothetical protein N7528_008609 [Penicillium herquei]|nr:hypothetical protein N7528_008609 [Penicillium herquei]
MAALEAWGAARRVAYPHVYWQLSCFPDAPQAIGLLLPSPLQSPLDIQKCFSCKPICLTGAKRALLIGKEL